MPNNYTLFAGEIKDITREERDWLVKVLHADIDGDGKQVLEDAGIVVFCEEWPGFMWGFQGTGLDLWSDSDGDLDNVAVVVMTFLRKFRPDATWGMEWAHTCDKPKSKAGGGAMVVTANNVRWLSTGDWMHDVMEDPESWPDKSEDW